MDFTEYEAKMKKAIEFLKETYGEIRAGRANPRILDKVNVMYYGTKTPINQVASISVPEAKQILIKPWDRNVLKEVERALIEADLGIVPQNDGQNIRLTFPDLTGERRKEIAKELKEYAEDAKVSVRNARREAIDFVKAEEKDGLPEDDARRAEENVQELTDKYTKKIDEIYKEKESEIMTV